MERQRHISERLALVISIVVVIGAVQIVNTTRNVSAAKQNNETPTFEPMGDTGFAGSPEDSEANPPDTPSKLSVYQGVLFIMPAKVISSKFPANVLEFGNGGRDIAGTDVISFRPGSTASGTLFTGETGRCSVDNFPCGFDADCSQVSGPQTCVGRNVQNLKITGDLIIGHQLCFNGYRDCFGSWPSMTSQLWELTGAGSALSPKNGYGIRIGESLGTCTTNVGVLCQTNYDCPSNGFCLAGNAGLSGRDAVVITSSTAEPAISVTKYSAFGELDEHGMLPTNPSGNIYAFGSVFVNSTPKLYDPVTTRTYDIWNAGSPVDTQDGSGIDADTFDSVASGLIFSKWSGLTYFDYSWRKYYKTSAAYPPVTVPSGTTEGILPMLCLRVVSPSGKVCVNGPSAGAACSDDSPCATTQTCVISHCSINTNIYCSKHEDCPYYSEPSTLGPTSICQSLCHTMQKSCGVDNIWHCSNAPTTVCIENGDCPSGGTCEQDLNPSGGVEVDFGQPCGSLDCTTVCRGASKCGGAGSSACSGFGTGITYNKGKCNAVSQKCLCSLNVSGVTSLPYIDATGSQSAVIGGELCSGNFTTDSIEHPPAQ